MTSDSSPSDTLSTLQNVVASAAHIAQELTRDPLLARLVDVFARMPAEDRATIIGILEREVDMVVLARSSPSGPLSGINLTRPNPNARLYLRVTEKEPPEYAGAEEIAQAVMRAARAMHRGLARSERERPNWETAIVEGLRRASADERAAVRAVHAHMLALVDEADRESR